MNFIWSSHEFHLKYICSRNFLSIWTSQELRTNFVGNIHELSGSFSWSSYEVRWPYSYEIISYELHEKLPDNSCIFPTKFVRSSCEVLWIESFCYICISSEVHMKFICNYVWNIEVAMIFICISFEVHMTHRPELSNEISYEGYEPSVVDWLYGYGVLLTNVQCHRYLYPYHYIKNTGTYNRNHAWNHTVSNHPIHQHCHTNLWYAGLLECILISKNAAIICGMYIINGVHGPEPRSSGGNKSSNPHVSALIPRPAFDGMERMCQCHGSNQNSHPSVLVRKPLSKQFIHYHISSTGVFGINRFKLRNFAVVAIECSFATVYGGSIMARIHRWSVMIYGSL